MAKRLTKIYTRRGDDGTTGLADGTRVSKDSARMESLGTVDELNSVLGIVIATTSDTDRGATLSTIQHTLFDLGGEMAIPGTEVITDHQVTRLEEILDQINGKLPPLEEFVLPGGNSEAAHCHLARAVCRRAERCLLTLSKEQDVNPASRAFLNRLSDLLFVMARAAARQNGGAEVTWKREQL